MGEKIENGTIQIGEIIGKTLDGRDIYKFTELGMAENVKIIDPRYKDGDFVVNEDGSILIFKEADGDRIFDHAYLPACGELIIDKVASYEGIKRHATTEEKQKMLNALAKVGKRWNEEKLCIEDIPKRKFKKGDKVVLKSGYKKSDVLIYLDVFDLFIGKPLTIRGYTDTGYVLFSDCPYIFSEDWFEPYVEELKKGDLAIFWNGVKKYATIRIYDRSNESAEYLLHKDIQGLNWYNAIKFESTEQFEKLINGEL